ncbi:MAG: hypothetical protein DIU78_016795 [Pseudomonadota bacterium]|nr:MAG: hypothetical protein DIU78_10620 [Pseudomonadota bacterium]
MLLIRRAARPAHLGIATTLLLGAGCNEPLSASECGALLDRYVTLLAESDRPELGEMRRLELKARAREHAARDPAFQRCAREVSRRQFECAMAAPNVDRLEQCLL